MKRRLVITTEIISPYRIPVFSVLAEHPDVDLHVIFLAETDPSMRRWKIYKDEIRFSYEVLPHWRRRVAGYNVLLNRGVVPALERAQPDVIVCGGYGYLASWHVLGPAAQAACVSLVRKQSAGSAPRHASRRDAEAALHRSLQRLCGSGQVGGCVCGNFRRAARKNLCRSQCSGQLILHPACVGGAKSCG